eukprot:TRINITY_DN8836_c0_g1_i1.p1 TRINITY_DN8836_c0_g1~~TRINITY_DN8836_c0_g1_i1.p1  ORF type:complete len:314 (+),score=103.37 TRINITY_DN8836_c0_g1_i1:54-995(+)
MLAAVAVAVALAVPYTSFTPGALWTDTDGQRIKAHSAGLLAHEGRYYWYGADNYTGHDGSNRQINVYSSRDMYNWKNMGAAFVFDCALVNDTKCYCDRPKVIYNPATQTFVMWMKSTPYTAVATAAAPTGPFAFKARFYPNGEPNGDPTAFVDPASPKDAYWIYSRRTTPEAPRLIRIAKMNRDWTGLTGSVASTIDAPLEAPAAFYQKGTYYLWTSHCSGWAPNAAVLHSAPSLRGPWTLQGNPTNNSTSFSSQSTYILPYTRGDGTQRFVYVADRFIPYIHGAESGRYVWLPLHVAEDGAVKVSWHSEWTL